MEILTGLLQRVDTDRSVSLFITLIRGCGVGETMVLNALASFKNTCLELVTLKTQALTNAINMFKG